MEIGAQSPDCGMASDVYVPPPAALGLLQINTYSHSRYLHVHKLTAGLSFEYCSDNDSIMFSGILAGWSIWKQRF